MEQISFLFRQVSLRWKKPLVAILILGFFWYLKHRHIKEKNAELNKKLSNLFADFNSESRQNETVKEEATAYDYGVKFSGKVIAFYLPQGEQDIDEEKICGPYQCELISDPTDFDRADAIIVDGLMLSQAKDRIKPKTNLNQTWVYFSKDPWSSYSNEFPYGIWNTIFNWTYTYHRDSDFLIAGNEVLRSQGNYESMWGLTMKPKTKAVLWIVNKCTTDSKREDYVQELRKYIQVDIQGDCGDKQCSGDEPPLSCFEDYFFVLSFEDTLCQDYITNVFYHTFNYPVLSIVRGGANYTKLYNKKLYLNTEDFYSPKHLAEHLNHLMKNRTAYANYLLKRVNYVVAQRGPSLCIMCSQLYHLDQYRKWYTNLAAWMGRCHNPRDLGFH